MRKIIFITTLSLSLAQQFPAMATRLSIVEFENKVNDIQCRFKGWNWWTRNIGSALKEMLVGELKKHSRFKILERATIKRIHENEHALVNSENAPKKQKGQFQVADFTIAGAVSELEYCSSGGNGGISIGGLGILRNISIDAESHLAKVVVDLRLIHVETGEILSTAGGEGEVRDTAAKLGASVGPVGTNLGGYEGTPIAKAARQAIQKAADELVPHIP